MTLLCHIQIRTFEYICNKTKYADNYGINITLMFINILIKIIDKSYSNFELYLNFKIYQSTYLTLRDN